MPLFSRETLCDLAWPATPEGDYARRVLTSLMRHGTRRYIDNVDAEVKALRAGDVVLPLVIVNGRGKGQSLSYVCSSTTHYVDYAKREVELELRDRPVLRRLFPPLLEAFRPLFTIGQVDRAVFINNWLLSTNLYPALSQADLKEIRAELIQSFPRHLLIFRSVNDCLNTELARGLEALGFHRIFSRQVWILDPRTGGHWKKKSLQKDRSLARRTAYRWEEGASLGASDCGRLKKLYDDLYLDKYSRFNPQFTEAFFREALSADWLKFFVLRSEGALDGVLGFVERQGVMTTPLIGYDRSLPADWGLYRLISLKLVEEAGTRGLILHQSSGAAAFKRHRGSAPSMEYTYVYDAHLPLVRRLPWWLLAGLTRTLIAPLMRRWQL